MQASSAGAARTPRGERTRQRLVGAARRLLVERGVEGMSLQRVGQEVGVSVGAVQAHFGTKTGLLLAVVEAEHERNRLDLEAVLTRLAEAEDWAAAVVELLWELHSDERLIASMHLSLQARHDPDVADRLRELAAVDVVSADRIAAALGVEPEEDWEIAFGAVVSMVYGLASSRHLVDEAVTAVMLKRLSAWAQTVLTPGAQRRRPPL